jgi:hypothetical protein
MRVQQENNVLEEGTLKVITLVEINQNVTNPFMTTCNL